MFTQKRLYILIILTEILAQNYFIAQQPKEKEGKSSWEIFPIVNYDTDVGFGYGAKGFFYNYLNSGESFDLTAYNSTEGERWYRFVYSIPDMQRRQGKKYGLALDLIVDYDKWINYSYYYGIEDLNFYNAVNSDSKTYENYIREPLEIIANFSSALISDFIVDLAIKYKSISCYGFDSDGELKFRKPSQVQHVSILFRFRLDTRKDFLSPQQGILLMIDNEIVRDILKGSENFFKIGLTFQSYLKLKDPGVILATRLMLNTVTETSYQNLLSLGGNKSIRGLPQDRYLSSSSILLNEELRIPIWWRFGGVLGVDIGNSKTTPEWILNPVVGLRFYMDNFIVRADFGFSEESTGFYFNFGHLF